MPQRAPASSLPPPPVSEEYAHRAVAYVYDSVTGREMPITREELGEYLIARFGAERLELMINRRIIEDACKARNSVVTDQEIEVDLMATIESLHINQQEFIDKVLKAYRKTLYEWKEDIVRPKLMMAKYVQNQVTCTPDDVRKAFEAHYGERIEGRLILWPIEEKNLAMMEYPKIRDSDAEFDRKAKSQVSQQLASRGGRLEKPIGRNTVGRPEIEDAIFRLNEGELTAVLQAPEGWVVFKCDKRIPPDTTRSIEAEREHLVKEIIALKTDFEIKKKFIELKQQAHPKLLLPGAKQIHDLNAEVKQELPRDMGGQSILGSVPNQN